MYNMLNSNNKPISERYVTPEKRKILSFQQNINTLTLLQAKRLPPNLNLNVELCSSLKKLIESGPNIRRGNCFKMKKKIKEHPHLIFYSKILKTLI